METEGSLPWSQGPATCPPREADTVRPPSYFFKIHFNIILPREPAFSKWSLSLRFPHQKFCMHLSYPPNVPHAHTLHSSWFDHPKNIWLGIHIMNLHIKKIPERS
jgi:hypothetical protein